MAPSTAPRGIERPNSFAPHRPSDGGVTPSGRPGSVIEARDCCFGEVRARSQRGTGRQRRHSHDDLFDDDLVRRQEPWGGGQRSIGVCSRAPATTHGRDSTGAPKRGLISRPGSACGAATARGAATGD